MRNEPAMSCCGTLPGFRDGARRDCEGKESATFPRTEPMRSVWPVKRATDWHCKGQRKGKRETKNRIDSDWTIGSLIRVDVGSAGAFEFVLHDAFVQRSGPDGWEWELLANLELSLERITAREVKSGVMKWQTE